MQPLRLALIASDPITHDGAAAYLRTSRLVTVLPPDQLAGAQAGLVLATRWCTGAPGGLSGPVWPSR
jgi:hypothetical protein